MKNILSRLTKGSDVSSDIEIPGKTNWLTGQFLLAMPAMTDPRFVKAVIYVCSHSPSGAMGIVINRLFGEADFALLLEQLNVESSSVTPEVPVQFGGPVEIGRGFVLHSGEYYKEGTTRINDAVAVTATIEIIKDIAEGLGPKKRLMALGYAGWGAGQLEMELKNNGWLTVPADEKILFDDDLDSKWDRAMAKIGVSPSMLSDAAGHA